MRKLASLSLIAALSLSAVACGSSGSDAAKEADDTTTTTTEAPEGTDQVDSSADVSDITEAEYVDALITNMTSGDADGGDLVLEQDEAECIAPIWIDIFTVDALHDASISVSIMSTPNFDGSEIGLEASQGEAMVAAFETCDVDLVALFAESLGQGLSPDLQECVSENVDRDLTLALISKTFGNQPSDEEFDAVTTALRGECPGLPG